MLGFDKTLFDFNQLVLHFAAITSTRAVAPGHHSSVLARNQKPEFPQRLGIEVLADVAMDQNPETMVYHIQIAHN